MMSEPEIARRAIANYLIGHYDQFRLHLENAKTSPDQHAIHQYRVSIKRIRALFRAVNKLYPEQILSDEILSPLKEVFKAGGPIRDEQVQLDIVKKLELEFNTSFPLIIEHFQRKIDKSFDEYRIRSKFFNEDFPVDFKAEVTASLDSIDDLDLHARLFAWVAEAMDKLNQKRQKVDNPDKLHKYRTRLKQLFYTVEMIYHSDMEQKIDQATYERLKSFGQELGDWHDLYQLWSLTGEFLRSSSDSKLLDEAFLLKKLVSPVHDRHFQAIQEKLKAEDLLVIRIKD